MQPRILRGHAALLVGCTSLLVGCATAKPQAPPDRGSIEKLVDSAARRHGLPRALILGVISVESSFNPDARSHVGAQGLMQLMPKTAAALARRLGRDDYRITDPEFNIDAGSFYLALLLKMFQGDQTLALAAYNTGPGRVRRWQRRGKKIADYSRRYVAAVQKARRRFDQGAQVVEPDEPLDRAGLRKLVQRQLAGHRVDDPNALEGLKAGSGSGG